MQQCNGTFMLIVVAWTVITKKTARKFPGPSAKCDALIKTCHCGAYILFVYSDIVKHGLYMIVLHF